MYLLIVFLPLLSSLTIGFFGRWLGFFGSSIISLICLGFSVLISFLIFFEVNLNNHIIVIDLFYWLVSDDLLIK